MSQAEIKTFHPNGPPSYATPAEPRAAPRRPISPAHVAEVTAETSIDELPELPLHLAQDPGSIAIQLRTTVRRVAIGAGLARRSDLVERVRALPGLPGLATSPAGGTFIIGGPGWLGLCAVGIPPQGQGMPLDWMSDSLNAWFRRALHGFHVQMETGKVEGAWCPGFSDIAVARRKLIGLGYRVTREWVVMRGVMPVRPISPDDMAVLTACHRLIDIEVDPGANTSLSECAGDPDLEVEAVIDRWRAVATTAG
jgi:hypothetical protein